MSWGYWSIAAGFVVLMANLFLCLSLVSGGARKSRQTASRTSGDSGKAEQPLPVTARRAG